MLKLILHNLWARRRRNGWLVAELVLVSVISWAIFDPVVVSLYDRHLPLGYDADRLALVSFDALEPDTPGFDAQANDSAARMQVLERLMLRVRQHPDVASATPLMDNVFLGGIRSINTSIPLPLDSLNTMWSELKYVPGQQFFETYGFRPAEGRTPAELSDYVCRDYERIMTEDLLQVGWGDTDPRGKTWRIRVNNTDTMQVAVPGAIGPIKKRLDMKPCPFLFSSLNHEEVAAGVRRGLRIAVRLKDGVGMERFLHDFYPWMLQHLRAGNLFAHRLQSYRQLLEDQSYATSTALFRRSLALSVFFLVNLCLGVAGTFWIQTRSRREEVGVHLSFGGTPRRLCGMFLTEGVVLVTLSVAVGCLIYWNYAVMEGLATGYTRVRYVGLYWTDCFSLHFLLVSLLVYFCLLAVTLVGVWLPARRISSMLPTEALREE